MRTYYYRARAFISGAASGPIGRWQSRYIYLTQRYLRYLSQTVVMTPWAMSLIALGLFAFVPQMQEIYIGIIEDRDYPRGLLGLVSLAGFSSLLYYLNLKVVTQRIDGMYPDHANIHFDRRVFDMRDFKTMVISSFPFAGLCIGLATAHVRVENTARDIDAVTDRLGPGLDRAEALHTRLQTLPHEIFLCFYFTIAFAVALMFALHLTRDKQRWRRWFLRGCYGLAFLLFAVPVVASSATLVAARLAGPLASTGFVLVAVAVFMRLLVRIAAPIVSAAVIAPSILLFSIHRLPFVLRYLCVAAAVAAVATFAAYAAGVHVLQLVKAGKEIPPHRSILEDPAEPRLHTANHREELDAAFARWLGTRAIGSGGYPVYIVTAQGGGMYASAAASFFLAKMQERCPGFAEHVFAISAVSGGSIGATLFDAALEDGTGGKDTSRVAALGTGCSEPEKAGALFERLRRINSDDHLSPVLAYILPDLVRLFTGTANPDAPCNHEARFEWFGRDQMLEKSFIASFEQSRIAPSVSRRWTLDRNIVTTVCPATADESLLTRRFKEHREGREKLPSLLLNATWVETGYRVAFSPFPLQHIGEGTLYSFDDVEQLYPPSQGIGSSQAWLNPSLIRAATVSARFPFVLPPWVSGPDPQHRHSFVDGGYADSSGATTGLELYLELSRELSKAPDKSPWLKGLSDANGNSIRPGQIELHLIALTDAYAEPDYRQLTGTTLDDLIAPFNMLLTVRELQAQRAVTRANAQVRTRDPGNRLITIQLDQQSFTLPLGWKQSRLSSDVIRFAMGRPGHCNWVIENETEGERDGQNAAKPKTPWPVWTVNHNSCELRRIICLFEPHAPAPPPSAPACPPVQPPAAAPPAAPPPVPKAPGSWQAVPQ